MQSASVAFSPWSTGARGSGQFFASDSWGRNSLWEEAPYEWAGYHPLVLTSPVLSTHLWKSSSKPGQCSASDLGSFSTLENLGPSSTGQLLSRTWTQVEHLDPLSCLGRSVKRSRKEEVHDLEQRANQNWEGVFGEACLIWDPTFYLEDWSLSITQAPLTLLGWWEYLVRPYDPSP
jgi:hypothetical protein